MKRQYDSPAWISAVMDDAGLTASEFRVLAHVCRRAGAGANGRGCDASVATMAKVCRMKPDTVRSCLQDLTFAGWLTAEERPGRVTTYAPKFPPWIELDPSPQRGEVKAAPLPPKGSPPYPQTGGDPSPQRGVEGNPEGNPLRETARDSNSAPVGTASVSAADPESISWEAVKIVTSELHRKAMGNPEDLFGIFPPEEVEGWARDWHLKHEATGGMHNGAPIRKPVAALTAWLRSCARRQTKRFKEVNRHGGEGIGDDPPFGA